MNKFLKILGVNFTIFIVIVMIGTTILTEESSISPSEFWENHPRINDEYPLIDEFHEEDGLRVEDELFVGGDLEVDGPSTFKQDVYFDGEVYFEADCWRLVGENESGKTYRHCFDESRFTTNFIYNKRSIN